MPKTSVAGQDRRRKSYPATLPSVLQLLHVATERGGDVEASHGGTPELCAEKYAIFSDLAPGWRPCRVAPVVNRLRK